MTNRFIAIRVMLSLFALMLWQVCTNAKAEDAAAATVALRARAQWPTK